MTEIERPTLTPFPLLRRPGFRMKPLVIQLPDQLHAGSEFQKASKDPADKIRFFRIDDQPLFLEIHVVPQRRHPAHPHPATLACRHLVTDALGNDFPLHLRE